MDNATRRAEDRVARVAARVVGRVIGHLEERPVPKRGGRDAHLESVRLRIVVCRQLDPLRTVLCLVQDFDAGGRFERNRELDIGSNA